MHQLTINGKTVSPASIQKIELSPGETPQSYVNKNEDVIKNNFKKEVFFEVNGELYVTNDEYAIKTADLKAGKDAKIVLDNTKAVAVLIDNESEEHKVIKINFEGAGQHLDWLKKEIKIKEGKQISLEDLKSKSEKLFKSGKFLSLDVEPMPTKDGINLNVKVVEVPSKVEFKGIPDKEAVELAKLFPLPLNKDNIKKGLEAIPKYYQTTPDAILAGASPNINNSTLEVYLTRIPTPAKIAFDGLEETNKSEVDKFFQKPLNRENIDAGIKKMHEFYNAKGLMLTKQDVNVQGDELKIAINKAQMPKGMVIKGSSVYSGEELQKLFPQPLNLENIQKGLDKIKEKYNEAGYILMPPEGASADIKGDKVHIEIKEAKIGDIIITGNDKTKDVIINRELRQKKGQVLNIKTLDDDLKRVYGTGNFNDINKNFEPDSKASNTLNLNIHLSEAKTSTFDIGLGYSQGGGLFGNTSLKLNNLGGMDRKLSFDVKLGQKVLGGGISYYDPWFMEGRTSLGTGVYYRRWEGPYATEGRAGAFLTLGKPLGDIYTSPWRGEITFNGERVDTAPQYSASGTGTDYRIGIKPSLIYSTLDDPVLPHKGTKGVISLEPVFGSATLLKPSGELSHNIPLGERFTLTAGVKAGTIFGNAPLYEKYNNAAQGNTLYGWSSDGSLVGNNYAIGSVGLNAKIWGPISATAKVTGGDFFDGNNFDPKVGAGAGLNIKLGNLGLLNVGYGVKLAGQKPNEDKGAFYVGFGIPF